jgi:GMP synthase-like glutamine amidotransferase
MRLGILNAYTHADDELSSRFEMYRDFFAKSQANFELTNFRLSDGQFPAMVDECDAYLITGSSFGVYNAEEWIFRLQDLIKEYSAIGKKLVGVCFGHQILAHTLGGLAQKSDFGWMLGPYEVNFTGTASWMDPPNKRGTLYFSNQDQVLQLPEDARHLAGNRQCPNTVLGVQAHPEFTEDFMRKRIDDFVIKEKADDARKRTHETAQILDNTLRDWIVNFLTED